MSEFHVQVIQLGKVGKHPNADTLSITQVCGRYPVIFKTGDFVEGGFAIHIPPDAIVDTTRPEFAWLDKQSTNHRYRVRFSKIRNIPSYGFLIPVPKEERLVLGQDVRHIFNIEKYDPGPCYQLGGVIAGQHLSLPQEGIVPHYDIEGLRKHEKMFEPGEPVIITEKIHGSNGRWAYLNGQLFCGSRTRFRVDSVWNKMAAQYNLEDILSAVPGIVLYGEVYGSGIQDLDYGLAKDEQRVLFFDVYDTRSGLWWDYDRFHIFCKANDLPTAPELYRGPFDLAHAYKLAEGQSTIAPHVREGIVIKPPVESWNQEIGRRFLKLPGEGYLLRKEAA